MDRSRADAPRFASRARRRQTFQVGHRVRADSVYSQAAVWLVGSVSPARPLPGDLRRQQPRNRVAADRVESD